jgi:hypothetical protein
MLSRTLFQGLRAALFVSIVFAMNLSSAATKPANKHKIQTAKIAHLPMPFDAALLNDPRYYDITSVDFELVEKNELKFVPTNIFLSLENDCSGLKPITDSSTELKIKNFKNQDDTTTSEETGSTDTDSDTETNSETDSKSELGDVADEIGTVEVIVDKIINIGTKIWNIIKKSRPVVNTKTVYANALPSGIKCWDELELWQAPRSAVYRAKYKNLFGLEVVRFDIRLMHSFGGQFNGVGRYITNAAVQYRDVRVAPGMFELDADVKVMNVLNVGTKKDPVAALQLNLEWTVKGVNQVQNSANFVVYGDGRPTEVHN